MQLKLKRALYQQPNMGTLLLVSEVDDLFRSSNTTNDLDAHPMVLMTCVCSFNGIDDLSLTLYSYPQAVMTIRL